MHDYPTPLPAPRKSHVNFYSTQSQERKEPPVPAPRVYPAWSHRDNGHSPTLRYRPDYASADDVEGNTNIFHHAYDRDNDVELLGVRSLVQNSDPCIKSSLGAARPHKPIFPLLRGLVRSVAQRKASNHIRPIIDSFERRNTEQDTTASSLDDSNKENKSRVEKKSPEKQVQLKRKAAQTKPGILSQLKFLPFKTRKIQNVGQWSKSETECDVDFTPTVNSQAEMEEQCKSVPVLRRKNVRKELMEDRKPLRPIAMYDISDTDPQDYPYMSPSDYRSQTPEHQLQGSGEEGHETGLLTQRDQGAEGERIHAHSSYERQLSPLVSSLAEKYNLMDWKDKRWKKYVKIEHGMVSSRQNSLSGSQNSSNNAIHDEVTTCSMFFDKTSPEKTCSVPERITKSAENLQTKNSIGESVRESASSLDDSWRNKGVDQRGEENRKKKFPTTFVTAAEVYKNYRLQKSIVQGEGGTKFKKPHRNASEKYQELPSVHSPQYLEDTFSGASCMEEDSTSKSLGDLEKYIRVNMTESITNSYDENDGSSCHSPTNPWMSPPPKYDLGHRVHNAHFDEHLIHKYEMMAENNLTEQEVLAELDSKLNSYCNVETQTSEEDLDLDLVSTDNKRTVSTSPIPEMVSYEPSLDHSDCDSPQMTPGKRSAKPRYSSSPIARAEQFGEYDIEGTKENGLNLEVIGKKLKIIGDEINAELEKDYNIVGTEENGLNLEVVGRSIRLCTPEEQEKSRARLREDCSERRKRRFSWKRLFHPKKTKSVVLLSYRRTDDAGSPVKEDMMNKVKKSPAAQVKKVLKTKLDDGDDTIVDVQFKPEDILGTVEAVFGHGSPADEALPRDSSSMRMNLSPTKFQSQSNESQTSQRLVPKESPAACNLVKFSVEDIVKELEEEGKKIEKEFLRIVTDNSYDFLDMDSECVINNPHSLMYLAGMACSKRFQLLYDTDFTDDSEVVDDSVKVEEREAGGSTMNPLENLDVVCGRRRIDFMKDDFSDSSTHEDTGGEEIDQDICPDSPGLIASMARDVQSMNLTASPNSSDADIARRIDAFLREALKPIDDLMLKNETSDDDLIEEGTENIDYIESSMSSQRDERVASFTPYNSPCVANEEPKFSLEEEEEECSVLNKSFSTEDSDMDRSAREALQEVEGVTPVMLDHQLQETESDDTDDKFEENDQENDEDDEDNTNNNFYSNDARNNSEPDLKGRIKVRYPKFSFFSPLSEGSPAVAEDSPRGNTPQPSKSDTRSLDTTGSEKFYTDIDTSLENSRDTAVFYTDQETDLDGTMEDQSFGPLRRLSRSSRSPASEGQGVVNWSMDDSIEV